MTTIRNIVVATDFSPGANMAVDRAVRLAQAHGASLRLLHVVDVSAWHSLMGVFDPQRLARQPPPDVLIKRRLTDLAASLAVQTGLQVEARFTVGKVEGAIHAYVVAHDTALLVVGSRAEPGMAGLGSTASKVVRSPICPVLIVRSSDPPSYDKVLCAVDLSEGSIRAAARAITLFPKTHHLLLCAVDPALERAFPMDAVAPEPTRSQSESMHSLAARQLGQLAQDLSGKTVYPVATQVVDDVPARVIVEQAAMLPADCVVVGHHGHGSERLLGSMAQHVLQHTARDVLVVP